MTNATTGATSRVPKSMQLYERALEIIPGATQLISRRPSRFAYGVSPVFATHAKGGRFWDVDGNEYIDWVSGIGAVILGYADPVVDESVCRQLATGTMYSVNHEVELELAELLIDRIPCAEMVRYAKGGGEACAIAVRIARGATGRDKILFCGYHGWHDWYLAANLSAEASLDPHLFSGIDPTGVPRSLEGTSIPFPYGDLTALGQLLDDHHGEVAAIMMEPFRSDWPPQGYLEGVAALAKQHAVVLIFDEVSTGFRPSAGGSQPVLEVMPDMAVFAKSISNGYPMGAVVGKRDVMEPAATMFISSTYWSDTLGIQAAITTLSEVEKRDVPVKVREIGTQLQDGVNAAAKRTGIPAICQGVAFHPHIDFQLPDEALKEKIVTLFVQEMAKRGCFGMTSFYLNAAHDARDIEQTIGAVGEVFELMDHAMRDQRVDELLECETKNDSFRRLVR